MTIKSHGILESYDPVVPQEPMPPTHPGMGPVPPAPPGPAPIEPGPAPVDPGPAAPPEHILMYQSMVAQHEARVASYQTALAQHQAAVAAYQQSFAAYETARDAHLALVAQYEADRAAWQDAVRPIRKLKAMKDAKALFCKRASDNADWYDIAHALPQDGRRYATVSGGLVNSVSTDPTALWPLNCELIETTEPVEIGWAWDGVALSIPPPLPSTPTSVDLWQFRSQLRHEGVFEIVQSDLQAHHPDLWEALEYTAKVPRNGPLTTTIQTLLGASNAAMDRLFTEAAKRRA